MSITSNLGSYFVNVFLIFDELHASVLANWEWTRQWITANIYEAKKYTLYEDVTDSKVPWYLSSSIWLWGVLSLTLGVLFAAYKYKRISEQESDFFYFRKLLNKNNNDSILLNALDPDEISYLKLLTYYYDPNIRFTCAIRRLFKKNKGYEELNTWLVSQASDGKKKKQIIREQQLRILNSMLPIFEKINKGSDFSVEVDESNLRIKIKRKDNTQDKSKDKTQDNRDTVQPDTPIQSRPSKNVLKRLEDLTVLLWEALELSNLAYWVGFSILCIVPIAPSVLALTSVGFFWFVNLGLYGGFNFGSNEQSQNKQDDQSKISAIKRAYFLHSNQIYDSEEVSKLINQLKNIKSKRKSYLFWDSANAALRGILSSFFITWMIGDVLRASSIAIVSFLAIPTVIIVMTSATLALGFVTSIYFGYKAYQNKKSQLDEIDNQLLDLEKRYAQQNQQNTFPVSVDSFDHTQRRFKEHHNTRWTGIKRSLLNLEQTIAGCFTASFIVRVIILSSLIQCGVIIGFSWPVLCAVLVCSAVFVSTARIITARSIKTIDRTKRVLNTLDYLDNRNTFESNKTSDNIQPEVLGKNNSANHLDTDKKDIGYRNVFESHKIFDNIQPEASGKHNPALKNQLQTFGEMFKRSNPENENVAQQDDLSYQFTQSLLN
jgi:hypothetical protein